MIKEITQTAMLPARLALRAQAIGILLTRYGVAGSLASLGIEVGKRGLISSGFSKSKTNRFDSVFGKSLALTFIKLGPTFIKLGQMLATRPDLVGEDIADELKILFDKVPGVSFRKIEAILKKEWGRKKLKSVIKTIEPKPVGSASLAQVHRAVLKDGRDVILKVQKDSVASIVQLDLKLLSGIAYSMDLLYPKLGILQMFKDFESATLREIDYREEAKNIDRFQKNYKKFFSDSDVQFPSYEKDLLTARVIVLDPMQGKKVTEIPKGTTVARKAAQKSLSAVLEQVFDHGFFHADPHAGNLFFLEEEGQIGFIDLGLVGQLDPKDKQKFLKVILAILKRDKKRLAESLFELGEKTKKANYEKFQEGIEELIDEVKKQGVKDARLDKLVNQLLVLARAQGVIVPNRYVLLIRSCLMIEGVAKNLDPNVNVVQIAIPIVTKSLLKSFNPLNILRKK